jgi:hypothetical protein
MMETHKTQIVKNSLTPPEYGDLPGISGGSLVGYTSPDSSKHCVVFIALKDNGYIFFTITYFNDFSSPLFYADVAKTLLRIYELTGEF